jgi:hypothetical protein
MAYFRVKYIMDPQFYYASPFSSSTSNVKIRAHCSIVTVVMKCDYLPDTGRIYIYQRIYILSCIQQVGTPTLPTAISVKSSSSRRACWFLICFYMKQCWLFNFQISFLRTNKSDRPSLPAKSAGQVCRPSLVASSSVEQR